MRRDADIAQNVSVCAPVHRDASLRTHINTPTHSSRDEKTENDGKLYDDDDSDLNDDDDNSNGNSNVDGNNNRNNNDDNSNSKNSNKKSNSNIDGNHNSDNVKNNTDNSKDNNSIINNNNNNNSNNNSDDVNNDNNNSQHNSNIDGPNAPIYNNTTGQTHGSNRAVSESVRIRQQHLLDKPFNVSTRSCVHTDVSLDPGSGTPNRRPVTAPAAVGSSWVFDMPQCEYMIVCVCVYM